MPCFKQVSRFVLVVIYNNVSSAFGEDERLASAVGRVKISLVALFVKERGL